MVKNMEFSEHELIATYKFNSNEPFLVDVGAHNGRVTRIFAEKGWGILAFEPERKMYATLKHNLAGFKNVTCISKAVSDANAKVSFYVSAIHWGIHSFKPFDKTHKLAYEVETVTLKDVLKELNIKTVTFLKIDIEGADFLALKGFDFTKYHPELIIAEFLDERSRPHFGYTHHDMAAYMNKQGYATFVSDWAPPIEYSREGFPRPYRKWLRCVSYPLDYEPTWGNLIFVPKCDKDKFNATVGAYLKN
ncbi:MAG: FkbM family methyltransferase [Candidatus Omnitrophota bacterium]